MHASAAASAAKKPRSVASRYSSGRAVEWKARDALRQQGFLVVRAAGSHGPADLVGLRPSRTSRKPAPEVWLVQCKRNGKISPGERQELAWLADRLGCTAALVSTRRDGRRLVLDWFAIRADGTMAVMHGGEDA